MCVCVELYPYRGIYIYCVHRCTVCVQVFTGVTDGACL